MKLLIKFLSATPFKGRFPVGRCPDDLDSRNCNLPAGMRKFVNRAYGCPRLSIFDVSMPYG